MCTLGCYATFIIMWVGMEGFFDDVKALVMLVNVVDHEEWDVGNGQVR